MGESSLLGLPVKLTDSHVGMEIRPTRMSVTARLIIKALVKFCNRLEMTQAKQTRVLPNTAAIIMITRKMLVAIKERSFRLLGNLWVELVGSDWFILGLKMSVLLLFLPLVCLFFCFVGNVGPFSCLLFYVFGLSCDCGPKRVFLE